jgi:hypothetical protein
MNRLFKVYYNAYTFTSQAELMEKIIVFTSVFLTFLGFLFIITLLDLILQKKRLLSHSFNPFGFHFIKKNPIVSLSLTRLDFFFYKKKSYCFIHCCNLILPKRLLSHSLNPFGSNFTKQKKTTFLFI